MKKRSSISKCLAKINPTHAFYNLKENLIKSPPKISQNNDILMANQVTNQHPSLISNQMAGV